MTVDLESRSGSSLPAKTEKYSEIHELGKSVFGPSLGFVAAAATPSWHDRPIDANQAAIKADVDLDNGTTIGGNVTFQRKCGEFQIG